MNRPRLLVLCTRNPGKRREIERLLSARIGTGERSVRTLDDLGIPPRPDEDGVESHPTFEENAFAKARYFERVIGDPSVRVLAEDSGLCVDALGGRPGVHSKRFSGATGRGADAANNAAVIDSLSGLGLPSAARYRAVAVSVALDTPSLASCGECEGEVTGRPRGSGGFGYDPIFVPAGFSRTMAELSADEKAAISHRSRALRGLFERLDALDRRAESV